jgi:hypothetical protein
MPDSMRPTAAPLTLPTLIEVTFIRERGTPGWRPSEFTADLPTCPACRSPWARIPLATGTVTCEDCGITTPLTNPLPSGPAPNRRRVMGQL